MRPYVRTYFVTSLLVTAYVIWAWAHPTWGLGSIVQTWGDFRSPNQLIVADGASIVGLRKNYDRDPTDLDVDLLAYIWTLDGRQLLSFPTTTQASPVIGRDNSTLLIYNATLQGPVAIDMISGATRQLAKYVIPVHSGFASNDIVFTEGAGGVVYARNLKTNHEIVLNLNATFDKLSSDANGHRFLVRKASESTLVDDQGAVLANIHGLLAVDTSQDRLVSYGLKNGAVGSGYIELRSFENGVTKSEIPTPMLSPSYEATGFSRDGNWLTIVFGTDLITIDIPHSKVVRSAEIYNWEVNDGYLGPVVIGQTKDSSAMCIIGNSFLSLPGVSTSNSKFEVSWNAKSLLVQTGPQVSVWDLEHLKRIKDISLPSAQITSRFSADMRLAVLTEGGTNTRIFDIRAAKLFPGSIPQSADAVFAYDPPCESVLVWNTSGQLLRYRQGHSLFGFFIPNHNC